jgi:protein-tyrosine-phosphatase
MNAKMVSVMKERGVEIGKEFSEPLTKDDIVEGTLLLAMSDQDVSMVREMFADVKVYKLRNFVGEKGDVEIPLGKSLADYEMSYEHIDLLTKMAAERLFREEQQ